MSKITNDIHRLAPDSCTHMSNVSVKGLKSTMGSQLRAKQTVTTES